MRAVPLPEPISRRLALTTTLHEGIPSLQQDNVPVVVEGVSVFSEKQMHEHADASVRAALEEAIDLVAFHGGSVEIEAAIRKLMP